MKTQCSACGADAEIARGSYSFRESGLRSVKLLNIDIIRCPRCGNEDPIIPRVNDLMRLLARAVIEKPYRLAGDDVRFLRKYLRMTQQEFAQLLHVDKTHVSKWENDEDQVGPQSDRLIRAVALALGEGLKDDQERVVRKFSAIRNRRKPVKIEMNAETMQFVYA